MTGLGSVVELAGQSVVLSYSGLESEYEALHRRAIVVDRSHRARMMFRGDKAAEVLFGQPRVEINFVDEPKGRMTDFSFVLTD